MVSKRLSSWSAAKDLIPENRSIFRSFAALQDDNYEEFQLSDLTADYADARR